MQKPEYQALVVFVARGLADKVMEVARAGGATGGTIIHARGSGHHDMHSLFSMPIDTERDIVIIILPEKLTRSIAHSVASSMQLDQPGSGLLFTMDIEKASGLVDSSNFSQ